MDHSTACASGVCPIVEDVEVRCDDYNFAAPGVRVAPAPNATWLATASEKDRMVFEIANGSAQRRDATLPQTYARKSLLLALDSDGAPQIATDATEIDGTTTPLSYPGGAEHAVYRSGTWSRSPAYDNPDGGAPPVDFEIGPDNAPRIWIHGPYPSYTLATRDSGGAWTTSLVPVPGDYGAPRFTLSSHGDAISFDYKVSEFSRYDLYWQTPTGTPTRLSNDRPWGDYAVTHAVEPATAPLHGPEFAALTENGTELRVQWPSLAGFSEIALPGTALPEPIPSAWSPPCSAPIRHVTSGVRRSDFAIARTTDGALWVAYVRTDYDLQVSYVKSCPDSPTMCFCQAQIDSDDSTAKLHLVRVATESSTVTEALVLPIPVLQEKNAFLSSSSAARLIDVRGFGTDLAIGLRTRSDPQLGAAVRVLRVDTLRLPR